MNSDTFASSLARLCLVSSLEKFSFHGVRLLLVLSMTKMFFIDASTACLVYGGFMAFTFCTPILSGWLVDNFLGNRLVSLWGGTLACLGSLLLSFKNDSLFYIGLGFIVLSGGMLRSTIPVLLSNIYRKRESLKDSGFTLWHIAGNLGAFLAALICGYVGEKIGWEYSFYFTTGATALLSFILYFSKSLFTEDDLYLKKITLNKKVLWLLGLIATAITASLCLKIEKIIEIMLPLTSITMFGLAAIIFYKYKKDRKEVTKFLHLLILHTFFMALYEQGASSFVLFIDKFVNKNIATPIGNFDIPTTFFQAIDPAVGMAIGLSLTYLWYRLAQKNTSEYLKFAFGFVMAGIGFFVVSSLSNIYPQGNIPSLWMLLVFLFIVLGELFIIPIGMSYASSLKVGKLKNTLTGMWLLSVASGQWFATLIAKSIHKHSDWGMLNEYTRYQMVYLNCFKGAVFLALGSVVFYLVRKHSNKIFSLTTKSFSLLHRANKPQKNL